MRTKIGAVVMETKGYDVIAELEQKEDNFGVKNFLLKRKQEAEDKARKFLAENPKPNYYIAIGLPTDIPWGEDQEDMFSCLLCYTDDEVQRLKQLIVEAWNHDTDPEYQVTSYEEIDPAEDLRMLRGINNELDDLLWGRAEDVDFDPGSINLEQPMHAYRFSTYSYDKRTKQMATRRCSRLVVLTDEEYLYLLTEQVFDRDFTFNRLLLYKPELAQKICDATADNDPIVSMQVPYIILMDEVESDMEKILGHEPLHEMLCSCNEDGYNYVVNIYAENDEISLNWQRVKDDDFALNTLTEGNTKGIDAKAVMQSLGAKDYYEMMERLCERFSSKTAYEELLTYLHNNGIYETV